MTEETFGPYRIEQLLGRGGMGEVHRAYDMAHDRFVALKRLSPGYHDDEEYRARFRREARIVARLREPHVIPIHAYGEIDGRLYLDMRLVEGFDLSDVIEEGTIEPARTVRIVEQVASALDAAHADGLVHRDVKPSNILVTSGDFVYLVDFGIARSISPSATGLTASGSVVGTLDYMAPERFESGPVDGRADVYALACVLFACLAGRRPFTADGTAAQIWAHMKEAPPKASPLNPAVPAALDDVIAKGMAKDPADRYATAGALAQAAVRALTTPATPPAGQLGLAAPAHQPGPAHPATPPGGQPGPATPAVLPGPTVPATPPGGQAAPPAGQPVLASPPGGWPQPAARGPQFSHPAAPGPQQGQPTAPAFQRFSTGPQSVHPQPYPPTHARSGADSPAKRIAFIGGTVAVVVLLIAATVLYVTNGYEKFGLGTTGGVPTSGTISKTSTAGTTSSAATTTTTRSPQVDALIAALPAVYKTTTPCVPATADGGAVAAIRCTETNSLNSRFPPPAEAEFRLFADRASQDASFLQLVTSRGIPRMDERGGCRPKSDPIHYALYYRDISGALPGDFTTCFLADGNAQVWWVDTRTLTIGTLKRPGDIDTLDKLDLWWNQSILSAF